MRRRTADSGRRRRGRTRPGRRSAPRAVGRSSRPSPGVGPGQLARCGDRPRKSVVGEDRVGADEDAVLHGHAVVDESRVLDLDPAPDRHADVDEGVAADDALGADRGPAADLRALPDAGPRADGDAGLQVGRGMDARSWIDHERSAGSCGVALTRRAIGDRARGPGPSIQATDRHARWRVTRISARNAPSAAPKASAPRQSTRIFASPSIRRATATRIPVVGPVRTVLATTTRTSACSTRAFWASTPRTRPCWTVASRATMPLTTPISTEA